MKYKIVTLIHNANATCTAKKPKILWQKRDKTLKSCLQVSILSTSTKSLVFRVSRSQRSRYVLSLENSLESKNKKKSRVNKEENIQVIIHTTYARNNMGHQKCEGNCILWVLNEIIEKHILKI